MLQNFVESVPDQLIKTYNELYADNIRTSEAKSGKLLEKLTNKPSVGTKENVIASELLWVTLYKNERKFSNFRI